MTTRAEANLTIDTQKALASGSASSPAFAPLTNPVDSEGIAHGLAYGRSLLRQQGIDEREFSPSTQETWAAFFRSGNTVASALSSHSLANALFPTRDSPTLSTDDILKRIEADKLGAYQEHFLGVETVADYEAVKADLNQKILDQKTMAASHGLTGVAAMLASGIIDLPSLMPGSIGFRLGAAGVNMGRAAIGVAGAASLQAGASELALHATQVGRTAEETIAGVGGSIILGGILGGTAHAAAYRTLGPAIVGKVEKNMERTVSDLADGQAGMRSAGAAQVNAFERMRAEGLDSQRSVSSFGINNMVRGLGRIGEKSPMFNWVGKNLRIPMFDLERTKSSTALNALNDMIHRVGITRAEAEGHAVQGSPVMAYVRDYRDSVARIAESTTIEYKAAKTSFKGYDDFDRQVTEALLDPRAPAHPAVAKVAKMHREVYTRIVDELIDARVLPPEVKERYGDAYFPMVFDADAIRADSATFKKMISDGFAKQIRQDAEDALRTKAARQKQNAGVEARIVGVKGSRGKVDESGAPVISPKTGKQVQEKVILEEGTQFQRERIAREQYKLRKEYLEEQRKLSADVHDRETAEIIAGVNRIYDETGRNLAREATDLLDRTARSTDLSPAQRAKRAREINAEQKRQVDALEKERRDEIEAIQKQRRDQKKAILDPINKEIAEAKVIRNEAIAHAKGVAKQQLKEATVNPREGLEGDLRFTRGGKVADDLVKQEADALAQRWYDSTTGYNKYTLEHEIPGAAEFLKKRRTPVNHKDLLKAGFVRGEAFAILEDYVRAAGTDAAFAKKFKRAGKDKDGDLVDIGVLRPFDANSNSDVRAAIIAEYDALRDSILASPEFKAKEAALEKKYAKLAESADDARKAELAAEFQRELNAARGEVELDLARQRDTDFANLQSIHDSIRGSTKSGTSASLRSAMEAAGTLNYVRLLGGVTISSLPDPIKIVMATGFGNTVKGAVLAYHQTFASGWKTANAAQKGLSRAGAAMAELHLNARLAQMADVSNTHRVGSPVETFLRNLGQIFSKATGITYWNAFWKQVSENSTSALIGQLAYKGWDSLAKSERALLANLRINRDGLDLIKRAHQTQRGDKFYDDWPILFHDEWTDRQAAQLVRHAIGEEINNQVITPQSYDRMVFAQSPAGTVVWQFRQHGISNQIRFLGRQAQLARVDNDRLAGAATGLVGLLLAGAMVDYLKQATGQVGIGGNLDRNKSATERQMDEWRKTPGMALYNALDRSDVLPFLLSEPTNVLDKTIGFGPKSALTLFDDKAALKEASRFKNRSVADTLGGPTFGLANDTIGAANMLRKLLTGQRIGRGDYRSAERLIPGQNIPYIQVLGNTFERYVGDQYSWPNPK